MYRALFRKIVNCTKLTAQSSLVISKRTMQTNYGDYVRFLELVGNVKVSKKFLNFGDLDSGEKKTKNISRSSCERTCDDDE